MDENTQFIPDNDLPHSIEAEQCVLGAVLSDPSVAPLVIEKVRADYFYTEQHKAIYGIIVRMFTSGQPIDIVTVLNEAEKQHIFDTCRHRKHAPDHIKHRELLQDSCRQVPDTQSRLYCTRYPRGYPRRRAGRCSHA